MSYNNDQNEIELPGDGSKKITSSDLLPRFYRTQPNKKFLDATLDQLISKGGVKSRNGYVGRKIGKSYKVNDTYITAVNSDRENYQFDSATVIKDQFSNVTFFKDYIDYLNQLKYFGSTEQDQNKSNAQEFYSWDPKIDWDKFVNYRNYYWLPYGPPVYTVAGQQREIVSTFTLKLVDDGDNKAIVLTPNGVTRNPTVRLYRGQTYRFEVDSPGEPIIIKTVRTLNQEGFISYNGDIQDTVFEGVESGIIEFTPGRNTEPTLYFMSTKDVDVGGVFKISDIIENSFLDLDQDILGKKTYRTADGVELTNGMKVRFAGNVTPEKYSTGFWYVEGVGNKINLVAESDLEITGTFSSETIVLFDDEPFDKLPFSEALTLADKQDYITVSRQSIDKNPWSRHNRWFHIDAITKAYEALGIPVDIDLTTRAIRPIIEFIPNIQLLNFGRQAKANVDLIDTFTTDVFSTIEGAQGFYVDGVLLVKGMRVLFAADTDKRVNGRIFKVDFVNVQGSIQITLKEEPDTEPYEGECVLVNYGVSYKGSMWHYNGTEWKYSQQKTAVNQNPLFDLYDVDGDSFSNEVKYEGTTFAGNKLFTYKVSDTGPVDPELGFSLTYQNIENVGDIVFNFDLESEVVSYRDVEQIINVSTNSGFLKINNSRTEYVYENGWIKNENSVYQYVVKQYDVTEQTNDFKIDCYKDSSQLDLTVKVFVNGSFIDPANYQILNGTVYKYVRFNNDLTVNSSLVIKAYSGDGFKIAGYYDTPYSLKHNPLNESLDKFTLGEVVDHVQSIIENVNGFTGTFPGISNLRDLGPVSKFGTRFLQHSIPLNLPLYHICNKSANVIRAIEFAAAEYQKFKRAFIQEAASLSLDGTVKEKVDQILNNFIKNKTDSMPFRFSDTIPNGAANKITIPVVDARVNLYPLTVPHDNEQASDKAVLVYVNGSQLIYGTGYTFTDEGFVNISASLQEGNVIEIYEYDSTDNCFVPPTPSKLGLYPKYVPEIFIDNTYVTPVTVIQGHDGSIVKAFGDDRDALLLELELRIFNNIKVQYDSSIFNIYDFIPNSIRTSKVSKSVIDDLLSPTFYRWVSFTDVDPTENSFYDSENRFTFNYALSLDKDANPVPGHWRGIFKKKFDTDRPHTHPWESLGFSIKPQWWEEVYGPAPYTRDNLILWQDLEQGAIREPNKTIQYDPKFVRPGLTSNIPVDEEGNLIDPLSANLIDNFSVLTANERFAFGDHGPVETAWRRSSDFPFQFIKAVTTARPAESFATLFDRSRQIKNLNNQFIYSDSGIRIRLRDIATPTVWFDEQKTFCSGLVNYICDYITSDQTALISQYRKDLIEITNNLSYRVEGFSDKEKFKIYLDSKSPNSGSLLTLPEENYQLFLNSSSPIETLYYSGVIIEKQPAGFVIRGYNFEKPVFEYFNAIPLDKDRVVRVGGISEGYSEWNTNNLYVVGKVVLYQNAFYRATVTHTSTAVFDSDKFVKIPELPITGGKTAFIRTKFNSDVSRLPYGTLLKTIQEVVDFLLGYGTYLESKGFIFDKYDNTIGLVQNWRSSAQEFLFWTTQGFGAGSLLALSPGAQSLKLNYPFAIVDNIRDGFNGYSIRQQDGTLIDAETITTARDGNLFTLSTTNTNNGIYGASLHMIQKEHVVIFDNISEFNDILFDQKPGFRQERIKVVGYTTYPWIGSFDSPGFVYDQATILDWSPYVDYNVGDIVKYKQFYYTAAKFTPGKEEFDSNDWFILDSKPEATLLPNWDYKADQFRDFYDLDSTNFDKAQQELAQHTIGYQTRDYLNQIIPSAVSQYKFYQGYIIEKGTKNSLIKFFDAVSQSEKDSLEFYEDWCVRVGQYGASDAFKEVEIELNEKQFLINPQPVEVVGVIDNTIKDFVYRQELNQLYIKPTDAEINLWPTLDENEMILRDTGYVLQGDVKLSTYSKDNLLSQSVSEFNDGDLIWIFKEDNIPNFSNSYWNVYRYTRSSLIVKQLTTSGSAIEIICDNIKDLAVGDYIALYSVPEKFETFYTIKSIELDKITLSTSIEDLSPLDVFKDVTFSEDSSSIVVFKLVSARIAAIDSINKLTIDYDFVENEKFYVNDDGSGKWAVYTRNPVFVRSELIPERRIENLRFGEGFSVTPDSSLIAVGAVDKEVRLYLRPRAGDPLISIQTVLPAETFADTSTAAGWGKAVALSSDGRYLAIGAPDASGFKSFYRGKFDSTRNYDPGRIVSYNQLLWKSKKRINGTGTTVPGEDLSEWEVTNVISVEAYEDVPIGSNYLQHQGYISIFVKDDKGNYALSATFCSPRPDNNEYFGSDIKFAGESTGVYTLLVNAPGANQNQGRIYTFRFDETGEDSSLNWKLVRNPRFRGEFNGNIDYIEGDIVYYQNKVFEAVKDSPADGSSTLELEDWQVTGFENVAGFIPLTLHDDTSDDSTTLGFNVAAVQAGDMFGSSFAVSDDAEMLVTSAPESDQLNLENYQGIYSENSSYVEGVEVSFNNRFYKSIEDIDYPSGVFDVTKWELITSDVKLGSGKVFVYRLTDGGYQLAETISVDKIRDGLVTVTDPDYVNEISYYEKFGTSVDISKDGRYIAVGAARADGQEKVQGKVFIFEYVDAELTLRDVIVNPKAESNENFGHRVKFNNDASSLAITSRFGDQFIYTTFDKYSELLDESQDLYGSIYATDTTTETTGSQTTFDRQSLRFKTTNKDAGKIYVFDRYADRYIYGESFDVPDSENSNIGEKLAFTRDTVISSAKYFKIDDQRVGKLLLFERPKNKRTYEITSRETPMVDTDKFVSVFLYNTTTNQKVRTIDFVDPLRGKLPGIAEQELSFKTYFDPAVYDVGTALQQVDPTIAWDVKQVGKLWWDLNNARFYNPYQGDLLYRANVWNRLVEGASIDVYEWVESPYLPSIWDELADTEEGLTEGISGQSRYGDSVYSVQQQYDVISQSFRSVYYFWVKNKVLVPPVAGRTLSANSVANLIADPRAQGYKFVNFVAPNAVSFVNCADVLIDKQINANIRYWKIDNTELNIHNQYQLITEGVDDFEIPKYIEQKWFDSLVGLDQNDNIIPDPELPQKLRYGILNVPRQGMFINRIEATKQFIERLNRILKDQLVTDNFNLENLQQADPLPTAKDGKYDIAVDSYEELRFIGTSNIETAEFSVELRNGRFFRINILNAGSGYKIAPGVEIVDEGGEGALLKTEIDSQGRVTNVIIRRRGKNYINPRISTRPFTVLVRTDSTTNGKWSLYVWDKVERMWNRIQTQKFDVTKFWNYADWYDAGYNQFTKPDYQVNNTYELTFLDTEIDQIVKVKSVGTGGWLLLKKYQNTTSFDYTQSYQVIGRQGGTIQFNSNLYDFDAGNIGYGSSLYDVDGYDLFASIELRIILETIRDEILIGDLRKEYNNLFFTSVRYILSEQTLVDWIFKTSLVTAIHNLGELDQPPTFKTSSLTAYQGYVEEVKPYRTQIREYISSYEAIDNTQSSVTDFDLPSFIENKQAQPVDVKVTSTGELIASSNIVLEYPWKSWYENFGFYIKNIVITDGGSGYISPPVVRIEGGGGHGAVAQAYISSGRVFRIEVINPGSGFISAPAIILDGGLRQDGTPARASSIIENDVIRSNTIGLKFDRITSNYTFTEVDKVEQFSGFGNRIQFALTWPIDLTQDSYTVKIDGIAVLKTDYSVFNKSDASGNYTKNYGVVQFELAPATGAVIEVTYKINLTFMSAADRIYHSYQTGPGKLGKDLGQLMRGVDYGGVEVTSIPLTLLGGFDSDAWESEQWDDYDETFDDYIVTVNDSTYEFTLPYTPAVGTVINVYKNGIRLDDPDFGTSDQTNDNAVMESIVGDGITKTYILPNLTDNPPLEISDGDEIIFRKVTSDGSRLPSETSYDTQLSGGDLAYNTASGYTPSDISLDGDGFITPNTSHAPEEIVPGHIFDSLAIKIQDNVPVANSKIILKTINADGVTFRYFIGQKPTTENSIIVKLDDRLLKLREDFNINFYDSTITLLTVPAEGSLISIWSFDFSGLSIYDNNFFIGDGSTREFITQAPYTDTQNVLVIVDGVQYNAEVFKTDETYATEGLLGIRFVVLPAENSVIKYVVYDGPNQEISIASMQEIRYVPPLMDYLLTNTMGESLPYDGKIIVKKGDVILKGPDSYEFTIAADSYSYTIESQKYAPFSFDPTTISVFVNGTESTYGIDYSVDFGLNRVTMNTTAVALGDTVTIIINRDLDYEITGTTGEDKYLKIKNPALLNYGDTIEVLSFYNHNSQNILRYRNTFVPSTIIQESVQYYKFTAFKGGVITLQRPVRNIGSVWVMLDRTLLTPNVDFILANEQTIKLKSDILITEANTVDIMQFDDTNASTNPISFIKFKDILNRNSYYRLNYKFTQLASDLRPFDKTIEVINGEVLDEPSRAKNKPGVIEIAGERVEYFVKNGNFLTQLRRGTLGTGVKDVHFAGQVINNIGTSETVPYQDNTEVYEFISDGSTLEFALPFVPVKTVVPGWYTDTIPATHGQCNQLDVFAAGVHLRKSPVDVYSKDLGPDFENDTVTFEAEFSVDGVNYGTDIEPVGYIRLTAPAPAGSKIVVTRKVGQMWQNSGQQLAQSSTKPALFLRRGG